MTKTVSFRNEAKRHLMETARRFGWEGKAYDKAVQFARASKARPLQHAWSMVKASRNLRKRSR